MSEKIRKFWLCRNTLIEMIQDRGYQTDQRPLQYSDFISQYPNCDKDVSILKFVCHNKDIPVGIHFMDDEKIGKSSVEKVLETYKSINISHIILVVTQKMSSASINVINSSTMKIEVFRDEEIQFNITKHTLVPPHRILSETEKNAILKKMKITTEQMPKILKKDPVCRYLGAECGNVIEITRRSRTAGTSLYYKVVEDKIMKI